MYQSIIDTLRNLKRHYKLFLLLALALYGCVFLFHKFYYLRAPYALRGANIDQYQASNELAQCLTDLQQAKDDKMAAVKAANPDLFNK